MSSDKRDECGCHKGCTTDWKYGGPDHACDNPCVWPDCLNEQEQTQLLKELENM